MLIPLRTYAADLRYLGLPFGEILQITLQKLNHINFSHSANHVSRLARSLLSPMY